MQPEAIVFGSIGTLAETSEMQRAAFNEAFGEAGLDWHWDRESYRELLGRTGGRDRVADYARERGEEVDAVAIHARKTAIFDERMRADGLTLRPGVDAVLRWAAGRSIPVGLASTTSRRNLDALLDAVPGLADRFAFVADASLVKRPKPDPEVYRLVCERLGVEARRAVGIEDTEVNLAAPLAAGLVAIAFPGANTREQDYSAAAKVLDELDPSAFERL